MAVHDRRLRGARLALRRPLRQQESLLDALADGLTSLHDADYSMSIAEPRTTRSCGELVAAYNGLGGGCAASARISTSASCCSTP